MPSPPIEPSWGNMPQTGIKFCSWGGMSSNENAKAGTPDVMPRPENPVICRNRRLCIASSSAEAATSSCLQ
jgi:hypothetical protein